MPKPINPGKIKKVLVDNLLRTRKTICKDNHSRSCSCDFGAHGLKTDATGCPELRLAAALLTALTQDEWIALARRVGVTVCGRHKISLKRDPAMVTTDTLTSYGLYQDVMFDIKNLPEFGVINNENIKPILKKLTYLIDAIDKRTEGQNYKVGKIAELITEVGVTIGEAEEQPSCLS